MSNNLIKNWVPLNKIYFPSIEKSKDPIMREHRTWHYGYSDDECHRPKKEPFCIICYWVYHKDNLFFSEEFEEEFAKEAFKPSRIMYSINYDSKW